MSLPFTILIVDDNGHDRERASRALRTEFEDCRILEPQSAIELERALETEDFSAVITDACLAWSDGLKILRRVHTACPGVPVLMFTDSGTEEVCAEAMKFGLFEYIVKKPQHYGRLASAVRQAVERTDTQLRLGEQLEREGAARHRAEAAEARFRTMGEIVDFGVWECDADGNASYFSQSLLDLVDRPLRSLLGKGWLDFVVEEERDAVRDRWQTCLEEQTTWNAEICFVSARGEKRTVLSRANPVRDDAGKLRAWAGINLDITDRKRLEEERCTLLERERRARREAEEANQLKDDFLAAVSHELRTPLNAMMGWGDILHFECELDDLGRKAVDAIRRNVRVQSQLIEDLLDMARIVSGRLRLDLQSVHLDQVVKDVLELVRPAALRRDIELCGVIGESAESVRGDPQRLQQIFLNLLDNAIKFTPRGGRIKVTIEQVGSHLHVAVEDTGRGISPTLLPHIFERFRQADGATTRREGGLGLGLALVKQLIELQSGDVEVTSAGLGRGSTFVVSLPILVESQQELSKRNLLRSEQDLSVVSISLQGLDVVAVDDDRDAVELVGLVLERQGARVRKAGSAREALELIASETPDVLISDVGMPDEDGYSLIRKLRLREATATLPSVALTAYARPSDRQKALGAGFDTHIAKPVEAAELITLVARVAQRVEPESP